MPYRNISSRDIERWDRSAERDIHQDEAIRTLTEVVREYATKEQVDKLERIVYSNRDEVMQLKGKQGKDDSGFWSGLLRPVGWLLDKLDDNQNLGRSARSAIAVVFFFLLSWWLFAGGGCNRALAIAERIATPAPVEVDATVVIPRDTLIPPAPVDTLGP